MKFLILLSLLACGSMAKKMNTKQQLKTIIEELGEFKKGQEELEEKLQSIEDGLESRGTWLLGMNINPADGHIFGYTVGKKHRSV